MGQSNTKGNIQSATSRKRMKITNQIQGSNGKRSANRRERNKQRRHPMNHRVSPTSSTASSSPSRNGRLEDMSNRHDSHFHNPREEMSSDAFTQSSMTTIIPPPQCVDTVRSSSILSSTILIPRSCLANKLNLPRQSMSDAKATMSSHLINLPQVRRTTYRGPRNGISRRITRRMSSDILNATINEDGDDIKRLRRKSLDWNMIDVHSSLLKSMDSKQPIRYSLSNHAQMQTKSNRQKQRVDPEFIDLNESMRSLKMFEADQEPLTIPLKSSRHADTVKGLQVNKSMDNRESISSNSLRGPKSNSHKQLCEPKVPTRRGLDHRRRTNCDSFETTKRVPGSTDSSSNPHPIQSRGSRTTLKSKSSYPRTSKMDSSYESIFTSASEFSRTSSSSSLSLSSIERTLEGEDTTSSSETQDDLFSDDEANSSEFSNDYVSDDRFQETMLRIQQISRTNAHDFFDDLPLPKNRKHPKARAEVEETHRGRYHRPNRPCLSSNLMNPNEDKEATKLSDHYLSDSPDHVLNSARARHHGKRLALSADRGTLTSGSAHTMTRRERGETRLEARERKKREKRQARRREEEAKYNIVELNRLMRDFLRNSEISTFLLLRMGAEKRRNARTLAKTYGFKTRTTGGGGKRSDLTLIKTEYSSLPAQQDLNVVMDSLKSREHSSSLSNKRHIDSCSVNRIPKTNPSSGKSRSFVCVRVRRKHGHVKRRMVISTHEFPMVLAIHSLILILNNSLEPKGRSWRQCCSN